MPSASVRPEFQEQLSIEILRGERLRRALLAGIFAAVLLGALANSVFSLSRALPRFGGATPDRIVLVLSAVYLAYELVMYRLIGRRLKARRHVARWTWYVSAMLEITSPTVAIYFVGMRSGDLLTALVSPFLTLYLIFILLSVLRLSPAISLFTGLLAGAEYLGLALLIEDVLPLPPRTDPTFLSQFYTGRTVLLLLVGVAAGVVAWQLREWVGSAVAALDEHRRIFRMFGQYTSPEIVQELLAWEGSARGERREVCVMFLDIRGFTAFAEDHPPEEVVRYLNGLLEFMIEAISRHQGVVHQLLGDGFMALFGVPVSRGRDVQNAVDAAREIVARLDQYTRTEGLYPTRVGIGIHVGEAVVGPIGSAIHREYKVTGDVVNVAERLEQLNKRFDSRILVSGAVWNRVRDTVPSVTARGPVELPGRSQSLDVYQLA